ncbi:MAG: insulinase family protein [Cellvibrionaceae bacterium]
MNLFTIPHPRARFRALWRSTIILIALFGCLAHAVDVSKSSNDHRQYRYLQLPNQLEILLISDPGTDKAAVAMNVFVGSADDPPEREGLAHFLEHMLFLGTEKYPEANDYQSFISAHGGSHNAYTALEHTNYFFDINSDHLEQGLDRFAQFFIAPLFSADYVERERNAAHSEYRARLNDEYQRTLDVYRQVMNPDHPLAKFSVGNLATLSNDELPNNERANEDLSHDERPNEEPGHERTQQEGGLRRDLMAFCREHYRAGAMALVVLGKESLDKLEAMVKPRFSMVPERDASADELAEEEVGGKQTSADLASPMFPADDLPMRIFIQPASELRELKLLFPIPPVDRHYRQKPSEYLSHLLGHESEGSLLSVLKAQGWAKALSAGVSLSVRDSALFEISISLTAAGLAQREDIIALAFSAIEKLDSEGIEEWRFTELRQLARIAFRYQEKTSPATTVQSLAHNLHYYEPENVIAGDYLWQEYNPELIKQFVAYLNPGNVVVTTIAPGVEVEQITDYFSVPYSVDRASLELPRLDSTLMAQLRLPTANPFIPRNLTLKPRPIRSSDSTEAIAPEPYLLKDAARIRVWFKQDQTFNVPRASTYLRITSPEAARSLEGSVLTHLYLAMVRDALGEYAYPASLAGMHYSLQAHSRGLDVVLTGYNDGQDQLFQRIVEQMHTPRFSRQRFADVKHELLRQWRNISLDPPYQQLMEVMPTLLFSPWWPTEDRIATLADLGFDELDKFAKDVFVGSRAELLFHGNLTRSEAAKLAGLVEVELLRAMADKILTPAEVVKLTPVELWERTAVFAKPVNHPDNAALLYLQGSDDSLEESAYAMLLRQIVEAPFFHQLRTERQLGYVVFVSSLPLKDVPGTVMVVQSPIASLDALIGAILDTVQMFAADAADLVPENLTQHKRAVLSQLLEAPRNLHEQSAHYWDSIANDDAYFDRRERLAAAVRAISAEELTTYVKRNFAEAPRALWVMAGTDPFDRREGRAGNDQPGAANEGEAAEQSDEKAGWMPISQWPDFKAERESYIYP